MSQRPGDAPRILIADDEADIALILKLQLEDAGYATSRARDGVEALELLAAGSFELLLLDIQMPRLDGLQVLERALAAWPELAVVMMTAHGNEAIAVEAMRKGASDYVAKPFAAGDLLQRVERAIQFRRAREENRRLQAQVAAERERLAAVLAGMVDLLLAVDRDGRVLVLNRRAEELLGVGLADVQGSPVASLIHPVGLEGALPCQATASDGQPRLDVEYRLRLGDGRELPVLANATPFRDSQGELAGSVEILRDISTLKQLQQEREDFVSMLSHDLKSPITAIVGSLDLVRGGRLGPVSADQQEFLDNAVESCDELVTMINTLLDVHRLEAGMQQLRLREEAPARLVRHAVQKLAPVAAAGGVELQVACADNLPLLVVDRDLVGRILGNLLGNALKFTPAGGRVSVAVAPFVADADLWQRLPAGCYLRSQVPVAGAFLEVTVSDTGPGIPPTALASIFDRFVQARNRRSGKTSGSGLGLAYCRRAMDAHGGLIWAENPAAGGCRIRLLFPLPAGGESP